MCSVLFVIVLSSITGELVPRLGGLGWDGEWYYDIIKNYNVLFLGNGIDAYHMTRFLPFAIPHYILRLLRIEITVQSAIVICRVLNALYLSIAVFFLYRISSRLKWKVTTEAIAFSFSFFNVGVTKYLGYIPVLTDVMTMMLAFAGTYFFLSKKQVGLIITVILSLVTMPLLSGLLLVLFMFPRDRVDDSDGKDRLLRSLVHWSFALFVPALILAYSIWGSYRYEELSFFDLFVGYRGASNNVIPFIGWICVPCFYFLAFRSLNTDWNGLISKLLTRTYMLRVSLSCAIFFILYILLTLMGSEAVFSMKMQFTRMFQYPNTDVLIFLQSHFLYLGPFFLAILFFWGKICHEVKNYLGIGYFLILILALFFIIEIETRKLLPFVPLLLAPLCSSLDRVEFKKYVPVLIIGLSLICSFFWFRFNVPGMENALNMPYETYRSSVAQRFFMFQGPWEGHLTYLISFAVEIVMGFLFFCAYKKGLLTERS